jgi:hypothetical protein
LKQKPIQSALETKLGSDRPVIEEPRKSSFVKTFGGKITRFDLAAMNPSQKVMAKIAAVPAPVPYDVFSAGARILKELEEGQIIEEDADQFIGDKTLKAVKDKIIQHIKTTHARSIKTMQPARKARQIAPMQEMASIVLPLWVDALVNHEETSKLIKKVNELSMYAKVAGHETTTEDLTRLSIDSEKLIQGLD